jgi:hypothetical protein
VGNGNNPTTTPTALSHVDGPFVLTYGGSDETIVPLNNTLIVQGSVMAWTMDPSGAFTVVAGFTPDYSSVFTSLATGELYFVDAAHSTPIYFTYKYQPMTVGSMELKNPWSLGASDVWIRILHEHANGTDLYIYDFWRARPRPGASLKLKSGTGDRKIPIQMVFDVFADSRYHGDSDLYTMTIDTIGRTITPDWSCAGAAIAYSLTTPV